MSEAIYWSACRIAREIRVGSLTSTAIVEACLERIERVNPSINAVVQLVAERALAEAHALDRLGARERFRGPLHGVPITIKDSLDTEGIVTTGGTLGRRDYVPQQDAPVVARLRAAGAVLLGKTNTPELTFSGETNNLIYGRTNNPYDLQRSPGGSSGGAAAIIACGGAALELGSDTGGSIREPAHLCGIAGIKPTSGRTPRSGHIVPYGGVLDSLTQIGPMARYVQDLVLALPLICGPDGRDPAVVPAILGDPGAVDVAGLRIAWSADNGIVTPADDIRRVITATAKALRAAGFRLDEKLLPETRELVDLTTEFREATNAGFILRLLHRYGTEQAGAELRGYLSEAGMANANHLDPALLEAIDDARSRALGFFADYDAILCPASFAVARPHGASQADSFDDWGYVQIHNLLGWPGVSVRAGSSAEGLPVGVQVVAAPWREDVALALAHQVEEIMGGYSAPPL
ncbi:MAG: amidase [Gammaproteobacteria bacterium]|nr:amidase [Gammaproteobacteria bacterium]MDH3449955.1 amidase [Gammaproteobacteria bacterium]